MSAGEQARGGKGEGVVVNDQFNPFGEGMERGRADDGASIRFVDCHVWFGSEKTSGVYLYRVKDSGFVGAEDLGVSVRHA